MRRHLFILPVILTLAVALTACDPMPAKPGDKSIGSKGAGQVQPSGGATDRELDAQLGLLTGYVTPEERAACQTLLDQIVPLREQRLAAGQYQKSEKEVRLLSQLNALYEAYTIQYLNPEAETFGYQYPQERTVAEYRIQPDGSLIPSLSGKGIQYGSWSEEELLALWDYTVALLPEGAFQDFARLSLFTDGEGETMAYVYAMDARGARWQIALDPADADDGGIFTETILHEYFHYLSLNQDQVTYTSRQTVDTYNEPGMVSTPGSYIDDFYQAFWTDYLDDCLSCEVDTANFFLRHYDDFIGAYASTDPSEDICESFTFFVLYPRYQDPEDIWEQKLEFFYDYPELVSFRETVRNNLGLAEGAYYEDGYSDAA